MDILHLLSIRILAVKLADNETNFNKINFVKDISKIDIRQSFDPVLLIISLKNNYLVAFFRVTQILSDVLLD